MPKILSFALLGIVMLLIPGDAIPGTRSQVFQTKSDTGKFTIHVVGTADHHTMGTFTDDPTAEWNPTRRLTITNHGDEPVVNPWVTAPGGHDWFNIDRIIAEFISPGMTDEEKAFALWQWCRHNIEGGPTYEGPLWGETRSMTRFMNVFGTGACGTYHIVMPVIGKHAGMRTFSGCLADCSHAVQQEFFDGQKRYLDAHIVHGQGQPRGWFALNLDNRTIASVDEIIADRYLIDRAGSGPGRWSYVSYFGPGSSFRETKSGRSDPCDMGLVLRPGESIEWDWAFQGPAWKSSEPPSDRLASGRIVFRPRMTAKDAERDGARVDGLRFSRIGEAPALTLAEGGRPGSIDYTLRSAYPITGATVGADLDLRSPGKVGFAVSFSGNEFIPVGEGDNLEYPEGNGSCVIRIPVPDDAHFHEKNFTHEVHFRATVSGAGGKMPAVRRLFFEAVFQAYRPSLASLLAGENVVVYRSDGPPEQNVTVEYEWVDAAGWRVPDAPDGPVFPENGGRFGFNEVLRWRPAKIDPSDSIADYEIYVSSRPDLAWPVMPNTHRFIQGPTPEFALVAPDVLRPEGEYFWRVRARSGRGVWGPWSETWSFVAEGPGQPRNIQAVADPESGECEIRWATPVEGTPVDHFEVYGSGEFGFSPRRKDEIGGVFGKKVLRPANMVAKTEVTVLDVSDRPEVFFRVTAVDADGNRGVPTRIVKVPSPALLPLDLPSATAGVAYEATLPSRLRTGRPTLSLQEGIITDRADEPVFSLKAAPEWVRLATETGAISGVPPAESIGVVENLNVMLEDEKGGSVQREYRLQILGGKETVETVPGE